MSCELSSIWPDDLYFVVPASGGTYISAGGQIVALPVAFRGWKVRVKRNSQAQYSGNPGDGDSYFTSNPSTNTVNISPDAGTGEKFIIEAYKPSGT